MNTIITTTFIFLSLPIYSQVELPITCLNSGIINNDYLVDTIYDEDHKMIHKITIAGKPPEHYRAPIAQFTRTSVILPNTPAYNWSFGCSSTSASMMAGFYDINGYPEVYTGPTNGGVAPMTNEIWGIVMINGDEYTQCPLSATMQGLDGRETFGHVNDYWITYYNQDPDPFIGNWPEHEYSDCTGDFMKTNQSGFENIDGATIFFFEEDGSPHIGAEYNDGCYGLKLFFESRGYTVDAYYSQYVYGYGGNVLGCTFDDYMQEIDSGHPVLIHVAGHTMLGFGYDSATSTVYLHDTWEFNDHEMIWGTDYGGMVHMGVTVIHLGETPDLVILDHAIDPEVVLAGGIVNTMSEVKNQGEGVAGPSMLDYFLSADTIKDDSDLELGSGSIYELGAGQSVLLEDSLLIPITTAGGPWYLLFISDAGKQVAESDESNNVKYHAFYVDTTSTTVPDAAMAARFVKLYPNPARGLLHIDLTLLKEQQIAIELIHPLGLSLTVPVTNSGIPGVVTVNLNGIPSGICLVQIRFNECVIRKRVLILK